MNNFEKQEHNISDFSPGVKRNYRNNQFQKAKD